MGIALTSGRNRRNRDEHPSCDTQKSPLHEWATKIDWCVAPTGIDVMYSSKRSAVEVAPIDSEAISPANLRISAVKGDHGYGRRLHADDHRRATCRTEQSVA